MSLAKIVLAGALSADPEKRFTPNENVPVTTFFLTVSQPPRAAGSNVPDAPVQIKVTCWRQLAEVAAEQLHNGDEVVVEGKLLINSFQDPQGTQKKAFEIEAFSIATIPGPAQPLLVGTTPGTGASSRSSSPAPVAYPQPVASPVAAAMPTTDIRPEDLLTEDDIPF